MANGIRNNKKTVININDVMYNCDIIAGGEKTNEGLSLTTLFPFNLIILDNMGLTDFYSKIKEKVDHEKTNIKDIMRCFEKDEGINAFNFSSFLCGFRPGIWTPVGYSAHRRTSVQVNFLGTGRFKKIEIDIDALRDKERSECIDKIHYIVDKANKFLKLVDKECIFDKAGEIGINYCPEQILIGLAVLEKRGIHWNANFEDETKKEFVGSNIFSH